MTNIRVQKMPKINCFFCQLPLHVGVTRAKLFIEVILLLKLEEADEIA